MNSGKKLIALHNVTANPHRVEFSDHTDLLGIDNWHELISDTKYDEGLGAISLQPYQVMWLVVV